MSITETRINSLGDLIDAVTPVEPDAETGRRRDSGIYRGMSDTRWPLLSSLDQLGGVDPPHTKAELEEHILRNFIDQLDLVGMDERLIFPEIDGVAAKMQRYYS
jgi:hypothetical protein